MEQCPPSETGNRLAGQEFLCLPRNPKIHYRIHKCPPLVPVLSQLHPVSNITLSVFKLHFSILSYTSISPSLLLPSSFQIKMLYESLITPCVLHISLILSSYF